MSATESTSGHDFANLGPELICDAMESLGLIPDGRLLALNSFENRVYRVGLEEARPMVVKFYRAGRWSDEMIREEHAFSQELVEADLPVVAPMLINGQTLHFFQDQRLAVYPLCPGREPDLEDLDNQRWLGRTLARMHQVGRRRSFQHRRTLEPLVWLSESRASVLACGQLPDYLLERYQALIEQLGEVIAARFDAIAAPNLRCHGDCHRGNVLWGAQGPHFVDLDDAINAPAVQDLWMLTPASGPAVEAALRQVLEGYEQFQEFDRSELALVEPLRALRMVRHQAWIAGRWDDPAFPLAFPGFAQPRHWEEHISDLTEQLQRLETGE